MVIKRKLFSKEVERKKSDKGWDAALGAGIGAVYGRDNNPKKQRDKIEDAAGDRVAGIVRGKKEK